MKKSISNYSTEKRTEDGLYISPDRRSKGLKNKGNVVTILEDGQTVQVDLSTGGPNAEKRKHIGVYTLLDLKDWEALGTTSTRWEVVSKRRRRTDKTISLYCVRVENNYYRDENDKWKNKRNRIYMHRAILDAPDGMQVDHINGDTLDNRRSNLRLVTPTDNMRAYRSPSKKTSQYRGVFRYENNSLNPWVATITVNYKNIHLGYFKTEEEAALAYNKAAEEYFGEYAQLNQFTEQ